MNWFSNNIKFLLTTYNIPRNEFANVIGKKRSVIGSYIRGEAQPSMNILIQIAKYFSIDLNMLITSDLEHEFKNKKLSNIKQLQNLASNRNRSLDKQAEFDNKISEKIRQIDDKFKYLKNDIDKLDNGQQEILSENKKIKDKLSELYKNKVDKNQFLFLNKYLNTKSIGFYFVLLIIIFLIYIGIYNLTNRNSISEDELFSKYYNPYIEDVYKNYNHELLKIREYYAIGDYYGVLDMFNKSFSEDSSTIDRFFYQGLVYLELCQLQSAIENFTKILLLKSNKYLDESRWYLALCYLKLGEKTKARYYFEEIINKQRYMNEEAKKILRKLR